MTPSIFTQLYTIHGVYRGAVFPLVFALLSDKQQQTYENLIEELRRLRPTWRPKSVMVDFEKAAINAFHNAFDTPTNRFSISGCFFHLQKSILRKVQVSYHDLINYLLNCFIFFRILDGKAITKMILNSLTMSTKSVLSLFYL